MRKCCRVVGVSARITEGSGSVRDDGLSYFFFFLVALSFFGRPELDSLTMLIANCCPLYTKLFYDHMNNNVF